MTARNPWETETDRTPNDERRERPTQVSSPRPQAAPEKGRPSSQALARFREEFERKLAAERRKVRE